MLPSVHLFTMGFKKTKHMGLDFPLPVLRVWLQGFVLCLLLFWGGGVWGPHLVMFNYYSWLRGNIYGAGDLTRVGCK